MPIVNFVEPEPEYPTIWVDPQDTSLKRHCRYHAKSQENIAHFVLNSEGVDHEMTDDAIWILGAFIHYHVTCTDSQAFRVMLHPLGHFDPDTGERLGLF